MDNGRVSESQNQIAVIVPFKSSTRGKSRIELPTEGRSGLAVAMMRDTVHALLAAETTSCVLLVVENPKDISGLLEQESAAIRDGRIDVMIVTDPGLNTAILAGKQHLVDVERTGRVAAVLADLPALTGPEFDAAVARAKSHKLAVVPDRNGVGSTMLFADDIASLAPHFGAKSLEAHREGGAAIIDLPKTSGLRHDVDELSDLLTAGKSLALGEHTAALVRAMAAVS